MNKKDMNIELKSLRSWLKNVAEVQIELANKLGYGIGYIPKLEDGIYIKLKKMDGLSMARIEQLENDVESLRGQVNGMPENIEWVYQKKCGLGECIEKINIIDLLEMIIANMGVKIKQIPASKISERHVLEKIETTKSDSERES